MRRSVRSLRGYFVRKNDHVSLMKTVLEPFGQDQGEVVDGCLGSLGKDDCAFRRRRLRLAGEAESVKSGQSALSFPSQAHEVHVLPKRAHRFGAKFGVSVESCEHGVFE